MTKKMMILSLLLTLSGVGPACADSYDDCLNECMAAQTRCVEGITLYDETGIAEAKAACGKDFVDCKARCHEDDAKSNADASADIERRQAEEAERKRKEEEQQDSNGVKPYRFNE